MKQSVILGDLAGAIENFSFVFANGININSDVVPVWKVQVGKPDATAIIFLLS